MSERSKKIVFLSQQVHGGGRKTSIGFMAESFVRAGFELSYVTMGFSFLSYLVGDPRLPAARRLGVNRWIRSDDGTEAFLWRSPFHPVNLKRSLPNALAGIFYRLYPYLLPASVRERLAKADYVLVESCPGVMFAARRDVLAPRAHWIYKASDRFTTIGSHPILDAYRSRHQDAFDTVHLSAHAMTRDFPNHRNLRVVHYGMDVDKILKTYPDPYVPGSRNAICIGDMRFDESVIDLLASRFPEWTFHLFGGRTRPLVAKDNIVVHGEVPFETIVPHVQHADVGIAPYVESVDGDYLVETSNKMALYRACGLPIVGPHFIAGGAVRVDAYDPTDPESVVRAFDAAVARGRGEALRRDQLTTWDEVVAKILADEVPAQ